MILILLWYSPTFPIYNKPSLGEKIARWRISHISLSKITLAYITDATVLQCLNTWMPEYSGGYFADDVSKCNFVCWLNFTEISHNATTNRKIRYVFKKLACVIKLRFRFADDEKKIFSDISEQYLNQSRQKFMKNVPFSNNAWNYYS